MSTSVPIHTDFNLQKELCYFQSRLQSTMTDLRPLMGLHFECVSVSYSPGLDSKGLHQRKLQGVTEPQRGCSPHCCAICLYTSQQSCDVLNKPLGLLLWPESRDPEHWWHDSFSSHFHPSWNSASITRSIFSKLLSHDIALFLLTFEPTDFCESKARAKLCVVICFGGFCLFVCILNTIFGLSCSAILQISQ